MLASAKVIPKRIVRIVTSTHCVDIQTLHQFDILNHTVSSADSLLINVKAHPKRYVHFSIFGKKDK